MLVELGRDLPKSDVPEGSGRARQSVNNAASLGIGSRQASQLAQVLSAAGEEVGAELSEGVGHGSARRAST